MTRSCAHPASRLPWRRVALCLSLLALSALHPLNAQPSLERGTVIEAAERLQAGEYLWAPQIAPEGPVMMVVSLATQRAVVYRNGIPIGITTVSTGQPGYATPTGVFTILQKHIEHYSNLYDNAPMPYMQRLTWGGVALHAGNLPGYPASHGCIRLPHEFARLLYGVTRVGMTVIITDRTGVPRVTAAAPVSQAVTPMTGGDGETWTPELSPSGPVSVVISAADRRALVIRNGIVVGTAPVEIEGAINRTTAYTMQSTPSAGREWLRILLPGQSTDEAEPSLRGRIRVSDAFRQRVEAVLQPGTTVVVTADSLGQDGSAQRFTVIESEPRP